MLHTALLGTSTASRSIVMVNLLTKLTLEWYRGFLQTLMVSQGFTDPLSRQL